MCLKSAINSAWFILLLAASSLFSQTSANKQQALAAHLQKAKSYLDRKEPNLAIPESQAVVDIDPDNVDAQGNLGVLWFFQGKPSESIPPLLFPIENLNAPRPREHRCVNTSAVHTPHTESRLVNRDAPGSSP